MDLVDASGAMVADYSHGMKKKLSLAVALIAAPRLLFLDEPFEGVDAVASRQIKDLLDQFAKNGGTVFVTSHVLELVERLCNHIGIIAKGKLVAQSTLEELRRGAGTGKTLEGMFLDLVGASGAEAAHLDWLGGSSAQ